MASISTRRSEGFQRPQQQHKYSRRSQQSKQQLVLLPQSPGSRTKRPLDPITDNLTDPLKTKRARIAVEIRARPVVDIFHSHKPVTAKLPVAVNKQQQQQHTPIASISKRPSSSQAVTNPPAPNPSATAAATTTVASPVQLFLPSSPSSKTATTKEHVPKKHQEKTLHSIRQELDRLQPNAATITSANTRPGRTLRSQEATRFKSELSAYFPEYDELIGNDPKEEHFLNVDTPILVIDTDSEPSDGTPVKPVLSHSRPHHHTVRTYGDRLFTQLHNAQRLDFGSGRAKPVASDLEDPLPDSIYAAGHKKAERLEKSIRNTERGRAQHEKDQIIRLLSELQGHDWLRTMGVNGVTESRKKNFEPAREHFIKGCQAILDKFRLWSQEEKRRKLEKERAQAEESGNEDEEEGGDEEDVAEDDADEDDAGEEDVDEEDIAEEDSDQQQSGAAEDIRDMDDEQDDPDNANMMDAVDDDVDEESIDDARDYSEIDAAARQLLDEASAQASHAASSHSRRTRGEPAPLSIDLIPQRFTSSLDKKQQRDATLSNERHRGRSVLAWGVPLPDLADQDFDLPDDYLDEDTLKAHERQKRRNRRQSKQ